jgi:hypothetical protein
MIITYKHKKEDYGEIPSLKANFEWCPLERLDHYHPISYMKES